MHLSLYIGKLFFIKLRGHSKLPLLAIVLDEIRIILYINCNKYQVLASGCAVGRYCIQYLLACNLSQIRAIVVYVLSENTVLWIMIFLIASVASCSRNQKLLP